MAAGMLDANYATGLFLWKGQRYPDEASLLAAMGGSKVGEARTFGPFVTGANVLVNGDLSGGLTGWSNQNSGLSSVVSDELVLDGNGGTNPSVYHAVTTDLSQGYLIRANHRRGASAGTSTIVALNGSLTSLGVGSNNTTQTPLADELGFGAEGTTSNVALRIPLSATSAQAIGDNFEVLPAQAFDGYAALSFSPRIDFATPASLVADIALFELTGSKVTNVRNRIIGILQQSTGKLIITVTFGAASAAVLDMGVVSLGASHSLDMSFAVNRFMASLDAGAVIGDISGSMPGTVRLYVGRSNAGQTWTGTIDRVIVQESERVLRKAVAIEGDSYADIAGVSGVALALSLGTVSGRPMFNRALGGSTLAAQAARVAAAPGVYAGAPVHWDGDPNGAAATLEEDMALYAAMFAANPRWTFVTPGVRANQSGAVRARAIELQTALPAAFPNNTIASMPILDPGNTGNIPLSSLQVDEVHLLEAAMDDVADAVAAFQTAKGW